MVQLSISDSSSPLNGANTQDVAIENGRIFLQSTPQRGETLQALISRSGRRAIDVMWVNAVTPGILDRLS
jgi:hypothetical protein